MMNKNERMNALRNAGVDTKKYFTVDLDNGTKIQLIIDENGNVSKADDPIADKIIEDGYVRNSKLHRRFVLGHMFYMLSYVSYDGKRKGYNDYLKYSYSYNYTFEMMLEEIRVLSKLEVRDKETFDERAHFFTKGVVVAVMEDYVEKLKAYIDKLPNKNCKGVPYKRIKNVNIFVADLDKKIYLPLKFKISDMRRAKSYNEMYKVLSSFMNKNNFIKLPYDTPKSKDWIDAYKGNGAYYTLKNLVMFHGCKIISVNNIDYGVNSMAYLKSLLNDYSGEGWRMFALMKKVIADNGINTKTYIKEICDK